MFDSECKILKTSRYKNNTKQHQYTGCFYLKKSICSFDQLGLKYPKIFHFVKQCNEYTFQDSCGISLHFSIGVYLTILLLKGLLLGKKRQNFENLGSNN